MAKYVRSDGTECLRVWVFGNRLEMAWEGEHKHNSGAKVWDEIVDVARLDNHELEAEPCKK